MAKKTNKTSHVLNLLTNSAPAEDTETAGADRKGDVPTHAAAQAKVTVVDEGSRNDRVSQEILTHLSEELELEVPEVEEPEKTETPSDVPETAKTEEPAAPQPDESHSVKQSSRLGEQLQDDSFHFINVMEELIMQYDLDTILRQYNVCTCTRCKADVCALTLTGLPAKYVVASDHSLSPVLNYFKNRYKISILAELSKACTVVREHPHHER